MSASPTRLTLFKMAIPIMMANIATPLVGLVDVAVIGRTADASALAAIGIGTMVINAIFWSLGFLRMGSTGLIAQADGAGEDGEIRAIFWRAVSLGGGLGLFLVLVSVPLTSLSLMAFSGSDSVEAGASTYIQARLWGAPAALATYAIHGVLIGLGRTGWSLVLQAVLNIVNVALSITFVVGLDWGLFGVGLASALAQWVHLVAGLIVGIMLLRQRPSGEMSAIFDPKGLRRLAGVNRDIFIRTLALIGGFYWFNEASLREGADVLAANTILLQFISISAFFLDAFAYVTESVTGKAAGRKDWPGLRRAFILSTEQALAASVMLSISFWMFGETFIHLMTTDPLARETASGFIIWCALVPLLGMPSWQLDGLMIGTTRGPLMRNAMLAALVIYLCLDLILRPAFGAHGLWLAFVMYYVARAITLLPGWWGLKRDYDRSTPTASDT